MKTKKERIPRYIPFYKGMEIYRERFREQVNLNKLEGMDILVDSPYPIIRSFNEERSKKLTRSLTFSDRILQQTSVVHSVEIRYVSGTKIFCFVKFSDDHKDVLLEPIKPNFASIIMDAVNLKPYIDLRITPHLRVYHSPKNNDLLRDWFRI